MYEKIRSSESSILDGVEIRPYTKWEKLRDRWTHFNEQHSGYILLANFVLLLASISTLFITISISSRHTSTFVEDYIEEFSSYSPARSAVRYVEGVFNTTQGSDSPYVGTANITNEMWDFVYETFEFGLGLHLLMIIFRTADVGDQMITPEELKLLGKPETSIKVKHPKTGVEGYRIGLEVFHQLHCLNLVRKSTFGDFFKGQGDFAEKDEKKLRGHIGMAW